ncbi:MAG: hypothetical protein AB7K68_02075 [Bacteriovoracia bacterium]
MRLPTRKRQKKNPTSLPKDFLKTVSDLFKKQFKTKLKGATFLVYGDLYGDEAIFCVSMGHPKSLQSASMHISSELSSDTAEKPEKVTERLKLMVDVAASWFAQSLESGKGLEGVIEEITDLDPAWQELEWEGHALFVKINKDNYALERAADDFLKKAGFEEDEDDVDEMLEKLLNEDDDEDGGHDPDRLN